MWNEIKTRKCFLRLASGTDAEKTPACRQAGPALALGRKLRTGVRANPNEASVASALGRALRTAVVSRSAGLPREARGIPTGYFAVSPSVPVRRKSRQDGGATGEKCPRRGTPLVVATRASPPNAYAETRRGCLRITRFSLALSRFNVCEGSLITVFLIANAGLEIRVTPFKNRHLKISNRE